MNKTTVFQISAKKFENFLLENPQIKDLFKKKSTLNENFRLFRLEKALGNNPVFNLKLERQVKQEPAPKDWESQTKKIVKIVKSNEKTLKKMMKSCGEADFQRFFETEMQMNKDKMRFKRRHSTATTLKTTNSTVRRPQSANSVNFHMEEKRLKEKKVMETDAKKRPQTAKRLAILLQSHKTKGKSERENGLGDLLKISGFSALTKNFNTTKSYFD